MRGYVLPPKGAAGWDRAWKVMVGARALRPGAHSFRAVEVRYHVGWRHFRAVFNDAFVICAPESALRDDGRCVP